MIPYVVCRNRLHDELMRNSMNISPSFSSLFQVEPPSLQLFQPLRMARLVTANPLCVLLPHQTPQSLPLWKTALSATLTRPTTCSMYRLYVRLFPQVIVNIFRASTYSYLNLWHLMWWLAEKRWANKAPSNDWGHKSSALVTRPKPTHVFWTWGPALLFVFFSCSSSPWIFPFLSQ